ncbi:MAG: alpha/beta fold hydrolase [Lactobacillales bacterium]|jgi:uncharacterized alpha/beta hydrolase family protein|nr:alpha/beta fold hydrolase [Lactobacillales bacterium]
MKKIIPFLALLFLLVGCSIGETKAKLTENSVAPSQKSNTPTLFIHGYSGTTYSFKSMIKAFQRDGIAKKKSLVSVSPTGNVSFEGELSIQKDNPMIQVIFEDNKNNEWNQTEWMKKILTGLKEKGIEKVNLVGHSMGGVDIMRYLTTYRGTYVPTVEKVVLIGAPLNEFIEDSQAGDFDEVVQNGPIVYGQRYVDFANGIENVPTTIRWLMLAGDKLDGSQSDGTVPVESAVATAALLREHRNEVTTKVIEKTGHSELHESNEVNRLIAQFLWEK